MSINVRERYLFLHDRSGSYKHQQEFSSRCFVGHVGVAATSETIFRYVDCQLRLTHTHQLTVTSV
jgi:hypothetical protein